MCVQKIKISDLEASCEEFSNVIGTYLIHP